MSRIQKVEWETPNGRKGRAWQVRYKDQSGKWRAKNFARKAEAEEFERSVDLSVRSGTHVHDRDSVTVADAAGVWLGAVELGRDGREPAEASTLKQYRGHVKNHIVPRIGGTRLNALTAPGVVQFRDDLLRGGVSREMTKKVLASLKGILSEAMTRGLVGANVALPVKIIDTGRHDEHVVIPSKDEIRALVAKAADWATGNYPPARTGAGDLRHQWFRAMLETFIHTGMRASEVRGLAWSAVNLKAGTIEVVQRADDGGKMGRTKSAAGRRRITIPARLVEVLKDWQPTCPAGPLGLVFPAGSGKAESHANILNRWFGPIQVAAGVAVPELGEDGRPVLGKNGKPVMEPKYGLHALRHFRASILIESGADVKEVQYQLGHSSAQMTLDTYGHLFDDASVHERRRDRAEALAADLFDKPPARKRKTDPTPAKPD